MEKEIKDTGGAIRRMEIKVSKDELQPYYDKGYKQAKKNVRLEGFRKGKVPMNMIKRFYGKSIEMDAEQDAVNELFQKTVQEDELTVLGQPSLIDIDHKDDEVIFTIEYESLPDFQLQDFKGLEIDEPVHNVEEDDINQELRKIQNENADFEPAKEVADSNHVVGVKMEEIDPESKVPIVGGDKQEFHVYLEDEKVIPELKDALLNKEVDDTFEFTPPQQEEDQPSKVYKVTVDDIQKLIPKELNPKFINEYTKGRFDSVEDLEEEIGFQLQDQWDKKSREEMEKQITEKMVELHDDIPVPEAVVESVMKSQFEQMKQQYKDLPKNAFNYDMMKDNLRPLAERTVRYELVRNKIIEKEDIKLEDYDIDPYVADYAKQMGLEDDEAREKIMQNQNFINGILNKKVLDFVLEFAETREVDFEGNPIEEEDMPTADDDENSNQGDSENKESDDTEEKDKD